MNINIRYLNDYPLEENYAACKNFLKTINWQQIYKEIDKNNVAYYDVSQVISLFPHLTLDKEYKLICCLQSEYHGVFGRVVAIKNEEEIKAFNVSKRNFLDDLELPKTSVFPMEKIYNDNSAEGYFEAVLCKLFLDAIPYVRFIYPQWDIIETSAPTEYFDKWNVYVDTQTWHPVFIDNKIICVRHVFENGFSASDGIDRLYLTEYTFYHSPFVKSREPKLCLFKESSVLIAEEKVGR